MTLFLFSFFLQKRANYKSTQLLQLRQKDISYLFVLGVFHKLRWQDFVHLLTTYLLTPCWHLWLNSLTVIGGKPAYHWYFQYCLPTSYLVNTVCERPLVIYLSCHPKVSSGGAQRCNNKACIIYDWTGHIFQTRIYLVNERMKLKEWWYCVILSTLFRLINMYILYSMYNQIS
jgi:hypothetical protein